MNGPRKGEAIDLLVVTCQRELRSKPYTLGASLTSRPWVGDPVERGWEGEIDGVGGEHGCVGGQDGVG